MISYENKGERTADAFCRPAKKGYFREGDIAFIVENHRHVRSVIVLERCGDFYTLRIGEEGVICLRAGRLFRSKREAEQSSQMRKPVIRPSRSRAVSAVSIPEWTTSRRSPYDYDNSRCPYGI